MANTDAELIVMGQIVAPYGIQGWVWARSFTRPAEEIVEYSSWILTTGSCRTVEGSRPRRVAAYRWQSKGLAVLLDGVHDRTDAEALVGMQVCVSSQELSLLPEGEYYWSQLLGLQVFNFAGEWLGVVDHLVETGANDVLVVQSREKGMTTAEYLIPWTPRVIESVDLGLGRLVVDWDSDY